MTTRSGKIGREKGYPLLAGALATVVFSFGVLLLPLWVPGYSQVQQTVSEIGMVGSPMKIPFTIMLCLVALCMLVFAWGIRRESISAGHPTIAAYLTAFMAISAAGIGVFSYPSPFHNLFGMSELIGYQAPLALAIAWRGDSRSTGVVRLSRLMSVLIWVTILLNLSVLDRGGTLWAYERPFYGLVQRSLFAVFFLWCTLTGVMLFLKRPRRSAAHPSPIPT